MPAEHNKTNIIKLPVQKPIVLVGLMGAGKTTVGKRLATKMDLPFTDSDQEIVEAAGCSISDIFAIYGEQMFRDLEEKVLKRLLKGKPRVLATGGGAFINPEIRKEVKDKALSIWLKADLDVLVERVSRRDTRPLLRQGDKSEILGKLMSERYPIYGEADITIESDSGSHEKIVGTIIDAVEAWSTTHG